MILKNKFYLGQDVFIDGILKMGSIINLQQNQGRLLYTLDLKNGNCGYETVEQNLYESKEAYEAQCNEIKVGDNFYLLASNGYRLKVFYKTALDIGTFHISVGEEEELHNKSFCFKTPELLLAAVTKAVREIK